MMHKIENMTVKIAKKIQAKGNYIAMVYDNDEKIIGMACSTFNHVGNYLKWVKENYSTAVRVAIYRNNKNYYPLFNIKL